MEKTLKEIINDMDENNLETTILFYKRQIEINRELIKHCINDNVRWGYLIKKMNKKLKRKSIFKWAQSIREYIK